MHSLTYGVSVFDGKQANNRRKSTREGRGEKWKTEIKIYIYITEEEMQKVVVKVGDGGGKRRLKLKETCVERLRKQGKIEEGGNEESYNERSKEKG